MAFYPVPAELMLARKLIKTNPEVFILDRFFVCRLPTSRFPCWQPLLETLDDIL